jgi:hypothetical protein
MTNYYIFAGTRFATFGGIHDFFGTHTIFQAKHLMENDYVDEYEWCQIVEQDSMKMIILGKNEGNGWQWMELHHGH